ncbi:MAG: hypothetical protein ACP5KH_01635, partial [Thermodesulfovibrio sp.]
MTGKIYPSLFLSLIFHCLFMLALIFGVKNSAKDFKNLTYVTLIQETSNSSQTASLNEENKLPPIKPSLEQSKEIPTTARQSKKTYEKTQK